MCKDLKEILQKRILHEYFAGSRIMDILVKISDEYELDEYDIKKLINEDIKIYITNQELQLNNLKNEE